MIKDENIRVSAIISKEVQKKLLEQAGYEDRSLSNLIFKILKEYYKIKDEE